MKLTALVICSVFASFAASEAVLAAPKEFGETIFAKKPSQKDLEAAKLPADAYLATGDELGKSPDSDFAKGNSWDGRFGTKCIGVCYIPLVRLLATPERYEGKIVVVRGFLSVFGNRPVLRSGPESPMWETIYLDGVFSPQVFPLLRKGYWETVSGRFEAKYSAALPDAGSIRDVSVGYNAPLRPLPRLKFIKPTTLQTPPPAVHVK